MNDPLKQLQKLLTQFTITEIHDITKREIPEISWKELYSRLERNRITATKKNVIECLTKILDEYDISSDDIINRSTSLSLLAVAKASTRVWISLQLTEKHGEEACSIKELRDNLKSSFRLQDYLADIEIKAYDRKHILSVTKKVLTKKRGIKKFQPVYFTIYTGQPYLFSSSKRFEKPLLNAVVQGLGYSKFKLCHLVGKNTNELLRLLKNKEGRASNINTLISEPVLTPQIHYSENGNGVSYSQNKDRRKYAEKLYGKNQPVLQSLTVETTDCSWQIVAGDVNDMAKTSLDRTELIFKAPNIVDYFVEIITDGSVQLPIPLYMKNVLINAKTSVKIKQ